MTVAYSEHVFNSTSNAIFIKLLLRWKGSIYKLIWRDLLIYVLLYSMLSLTYRFFLEQEGKFLFFIEKVQKRLQKVDAVQTGIFWKLRQTSLVEFFLLFMVKYVRFWRSHQVYYLLF